MDEPLKDFFDVIRYLRMTNSGEGPVHVTARDLKGNSQSYGRILMKKRLTQIAKENNIQFEDLQKLAADKLSTQMMTGKVEILGFQTVVSKY